MGNPPGPLCKGERTPSASLHEEGEKGSSPFSKGRLGGAANYSSPDKRAYFALPLIKTMSNNWAERFTALAMNKA